MRWVDFDVEDCTLGSTSWRLLVGSRTRFVAVGYASNAVGTINPVAEDHRAGASGWSSGFIDAVQYAPHGPIDVQALDCDFLAISAYKFFGPHLGVAVREARASRAAAAYKVRPAPDEPPGKFETGTATTRESPGRWAPWSTWRGWAKPMARNTRGAMSAPSSVAGSS